MDLDDVGTYVNRLDWRVNTIKQTQQTKSEWYFGRAIVGQI